MTAAAIIATIALIVTNACALYWRHRAHQLERQLREWTRTTERRTTIAADDHAQQHPPTA